MRIVSASKAARVQGREPPSPATSFLHFLFLRPQHPPHLDTFGKESLFGSWIAGIALSDDKFQCWAR